MKKIIISISILFSISYINCQNIEWEIDTVKKYEVPVGICGWDDLKNGDFFTEMTEEYNSYNPQLNVLEALAKSLEKQSIYIDIYFGAWCGDSREHVPHFIKINDLLEQTFGVKFYYSLYGCNRSKYCGTQTHENIELVPTFIVYMINNEKLITIGKIEETPTTTLEENLLQLLSK